MQLTKVIYNYDELENESKHSSLYPFVKRFLDITIATSALILLSPLLLSRPFIFQLSAHPLFWLVRLLIFGFALKCTFRQALSKNNCLFFLCFVTVQHFWSLGAGGTGIAESPVDDSMFYFVAFVVVYLLRSRWTLCRMLELRSAWNWIDFLIEMATYQTIQLHQYL